MNCKTLAPSLRFARPLLTSALLLGSTLLLGGCGGGKDEYPSTRFDRLLVVYFKPEVTETERSTLYEKYGVSLLRPYGSLPHAFVLFVPDDRDLAAVRDDIKNEDGVTSAGTGVIGPL
jgi:hypothetical protein